MPKQWPVSPKELKGFQIYVDPVIVHLEMKISEVLKSKTLDCFLILPLIHGALVLSCGFLLINVS